MDLALNSTFLLQERMDLALNSTSTVLLQERMDFALNSTSTFFYKKGWI